MKYEVLNHLYSAPNFAFLGLLWGVLAGVILKFFDVDQQRWEKILLSPRAIKKLPTALLYPS